MSQPSPASPGDAHAYTPAERHNRRLGMVLFLIYLAFYVGFVGITVIDYRLMARPVVMGLNLAIVYGMGLILAAFALAAVYLRWARNDSPDEYEV